MTIAETAPPPATEPLPVRGVFPISPDHMTLGVQVADELTPDEQHAVAEGNLALLPAGSLMRYLLEGRARADLRDEDRGNYMYGVCAASAVLRRHIRGLAEQGYQVPQLEFNPEGAPVYADPDLDSMTSMLLLPFHRQLERLQAVVSAYARAGSYFERREAIGIGGIARGFLTGNIRVTGIPFMSDKQETTKEAAGFWRGAGDTLALHYDLYNRIGVAGKCRPLEVAFKGDPLPIYRSARPDTWPAGGLTEPQRFSAGPDFFRQTHRVAGYSASIEKDGETHYADLWWNRRVPAGATLYRVRGFPSHGILVNAGRENEHVDKITSRLEVQSARLRRGDTLIVRGKDQALLPLKHPFTVPEAAVGEDGTVELVRLCRFGKTIDLMDAAEVGDEQQRLRLELLTQAAVEGQKVPRWRRVARYAIDGVHGAV